MSENLKKQLRNPPPDCEALQVRIAALELALKEIAHHENVWWCYACKNWVSNEDCFLNDGVTHKKCGTPLGDTSNTIKYEDIAEKALSSSKLGELFKALLEEHDAVFPMDGGIQDEWQKVEALRKEVGL